MGDCVFARLFFSFLCLESVENPPQGSSLCHEVIKANLVLPGILSDDDVDDSDDDEDDDDADDDDDENDDDNKHLPSIRSATTPSLATARTEMQRALS